MFQAKLKQEISFLVCEQELLGVVGENANAVHALINHAVQHPLLSRQVE
jgi:hypothetical protein